LTDCRLMRAHGRTTDHTLMTAELAVSRIAFQSAKFHVGLVGFERWSRGWLFRGRLLCQAEDDENRSDDDAGNGEHDGGGAWRLFGLFAFDHEIRGKAFHLGRERSAESERLIFRGTVVLCSAVGRPILWCCH
jgi:hypothetical protein